VAVDPVLEFKNILIFTDGACSGNPGKGGWAAIIATPDGQVKEIGGKAAETTNNRMEISAALFALLEIGSKKENISLYTDSTYLIRGITQWIWGWKKREWKNAEGEDVQNQDLWERLHKVVLAYPGKIEWLYSRGHIGIPGNERCDEIAVKFTEGKWVDLYEGPLLKYSVAIYDLPEDTTLPEMKPKQEKKVAYSYLSYLNGEVWRHRDWPSCERRVKGQSGAKFKKAMAAEEEARILAEWNLGAGTKIQEN
jgi:ribonuclease HI